MGVCTVVPMYVDMLFRDWEEARCGVVKRLKIKYGVSMNMTDRTIDEWSTYILIYLYTCISSLHITTALVTVTPLQLLEYMDCLVFVTGSDVTGPV
jgi:hypothetical protein